ncbi:cbb3-type cytochrome c oxidase subunit I [Chryseobacterium suipulveris]|uniref:Cbb3-type cytochrome c oxidase subunit I n=1 Tax=Chryseobacterium suipulveris TaxID=2929800 RepID=A0ABY4BNL4_9FLAO|nr:cbb3-type cytochrome c oxidase subunit I [Chryseobacterium suipulveris]UOE40379.1 cbb3-type cytochrome c oxidase subunit I [Chryseobacterium suipulveris]
MNNSLFGESGIQITLVLILLPILAGLVIAIIKTYGNYRELKSRRELLEMQKKIKSLSPEEVQRYEQRRKEMEYRLPENELSGNLPPSDEKGIISNVNTVEEIRVIPHKRGGIPQQYISPQSAKLILYFLGFSVLWLIVGTSVGEYLGIKFVAPDADHVSWLSFGRLRPVHTNLVFWGWASFAMVGLSYYVIPRVSNVDIFSLKLGWYTLILMNTAVILGSLSLMAGINNAGGEYREYIWPIMALFAAGIGISLYNFLKTIAMRKTKEIYVSNWYIVSAVMYVIVILLVAYLPFWQEGLAETIIQGYYMHQGVGMWFMFLSLGLMYYFLPQQLNKPIYSYSLGILAFWTQILFYTLIGSHHFIFSAIPWWMQTVAIVASVGMVIPVVAGSTNFILTFNGAWYQLKSSYTLPFYLIGIIFYFTGSLQGTVEAFRFTNLIWHFTDFTVAHSHMTMYGIITFMLWAFTYTLVPRLTGKEPPKFWVGIHFWLALIGLMIYIMSLMIGSTEKGLLWMAKKPFIESVVMMAPYWLWRAIGGTMMWISHFVFAYNFYKMVNKKQDVVIPRTPAEILEAKKQLQNTEFIPTK